MTCIRRNLDTQNCCNQWQNGIRTIDGQYPDDNREFTIQAGTGVTITPVTAGIEISASLPSVPGPMIFRGTLGTGGTITTLPPATSTNIGDVYVAIESGTVPVTYETGDMVISNGITWVVVPSGDDPVDWSQILNTPTTLSGYGITDAVDTANAQTVAGVKTFTSDPVTLKDNPRYQCKNSNVIRGTLPTTNVSVGGLYCTNNNNDGLLDIAETLDTSGKGRVDITVKDYNNTNAKTLRLSTDGYMTGPSRAYNASNTTDIVNIALLDAYTPMVRTTGNQTLGGTKSIGTGGAIEFLTSQTQNRLKIKDTNLTQGTLVGEYVNIVTLRDTADNEVMSLRYEEDTGTNTMKLVAIFNDGTQHKTTLASYTLP